MGFRVTRGPNLPGTIPVYTTYRFISINNAHFNLHKYPSRDDKLDSRPITF